MRHVLVVSFRFPPHGGGGVHRIAHFAKHLPAFDWVPRILTGPLNSGRALMDPTLMDLLPEGLSIRRTRYLDGQRLMEMAGKLHLAKLIRTVTPSFPNMDAGWIPFGIREGGRILRETPIDLIFSSAYPVSSHVVAGALAGANGLPWVADFRDEWSQREVIRWPTPLHKKVATGIDRWITSRAARVVTTSPIHSESFVEKFLGGDSRKCMTVLNGFDEEDFSPSGEHPTTAPENARFTIRHIGSAFRWRGPNVLLDAVRGLVIKHIIPASEISIQFVGSGPHFEIEDPRCAGIVENRGYLSHGDAVAELKSADLLVLINTEETNILAKTFEYLASGRPILALTCPGATAELLRENAAGVILAPDNEPAIEQALEAHYLEWKRGGLEPRSTDGLEERYSRRAATEKLAAIFDSLIEPESDAGASWPAG